MNKRKVISFVISSFLYKCNDCIAEVIVKFVTGFGRMLCMGALNDLLALLEELIAIQSVVQILWTRRI